jgi:hypothetical protein
MAVIEATLVNLFRAKLVSKWQAEGGNPTSALTNNFFTVFCNAIAGGITESINQTTFITEDFGLAGDPFVDGEGTGLGLFVDINPSVERFYNRIRERSIDLASVFGRTTGHPPWPPPPNNFMYLLCVALVEAIEERFKIDLALESIHPEIYEGTGTIIEFTNIDVPTIEGYIESRNTLLFGQGWAFIRQGIAQGFYETLQDFTTGTVIIEGECDASVNQICDIIDQTGNGTGILI